MHGLSSLKLVSHRLVEVLRDSAVRWRPSTSTSGGAAGGQVEGYVGMLEQAEVPGPVHSLRRGRRADSFVVSDQVRQALLAARLDGLRSEPGPGPFPSDEPGFFED